MDETKMRYLRSLVVSCALSAVGSLLALIVLYLNLAGKVKNAKLLAALLFLSGLLFLAGIVASIMRDCFANFFAVQLMFFGFLGLLVGLWALRAKGGPLLSAGITRAYYFWACFALLVVGTGLWTYLWDRRMDDAY